MLDFISDSNLPHKVKTVLLGKKYVPELLEPLNDLGIDIIPVPDNSAVSPSISSHADISVFYPGGNCIFLNNMLKNSEFAEKLETLGLKVLYSDKPISGSYPGDVGLNICRFEKSVLYSRKYTDINAINYLNQNNFNMIDSRQAYCRCSTAIVSKDAVITADEGIIASLEKRGVSALKIQQGFIELPGYEYGFIGGCTFKISDNRMAFTGTLDRHPDNKRILDFLAENSDEPVFLTGRPLFDIGTAIPIL